MPLTSSFGVNVLDFGVVGDGVADDGLAIQTIINTNPGRRILFPRTILPSTARWMPVCYRSSIPLTITVPGTVLEGETAGHSGGTILQFDPGVSGVIIAPGAANAGLANLILWGQRRWDQIYPSQCTIPAGYTGSYSADQVAPADDGVRVGANLCIFNNVMTQYFGRHGFNLGNALNGGTCDNITATSCYGLNNRGYGLWVQGGDANASTFTAFNASINGLGGINDQSFLGNTYVGPKTDENHFDNGGNTGYHPPAQSLLSITRQVADLVTGRTAVTLTFAGPYVYADPGGSAFVPGQCVAVEGVSDPSFNGVFPVSSVGGGNTILMYDQAGDVTTPDASGATARLATPAEAWAACGIPTGGAFITSRNPTSRTVLLNPYTESGQTPDGSGIGGCQLGSATTVIGGILGTPIDFTYGVPAVYTGLVPVVGQPGFYGQFPSVYAPNDAPTQFAEQVGTTSDQSSIRTRLSALRSRTHAQNLFSEIEGPGGYQRFDNSSSDPSSIARLFMLTTRDANGLAIGGAAGLNSQGPDPVTVNMRSFTGKACGTGGFQVAGPLAQYSPDAHTLRAGFDWLGRPYNRSPAPLSVSIGPGAGSGAGLSATVAGSDANGTVTLGTGLSPVGGQPVVTVNFSAPYAAIPKTVMLTPANWTGVSGAFYVGTITANGFTVFSGGGSLVASSTYKFMYQVTG